MKFVLHENPVAPGKTKTKAKHARVVHNSKLDMARLCELISQRSSLSSADVKGVLDSFQFCMGIYLKDGSTVELSELGHFYPTLRSKSYINEEGKQRIRVQVDTVGFRCSPKLKKEIRSAELEQVKLPKLNPYSFEKRRERILSYVSENLTINSSIVMGLNRCTRHTALDDLKQLAAKGELMKVRSGTTLLYFLPPILEE